MYKNFKITEEEKKQILESHKNYGNNSVIKEEETNNKSHLTTDQVMRLAKKVGEIVLDAEDELMDLCVGYGDKIPVSRVFRILDNYDMPEYKAKVKRILNKNINEQVVDDSSMPHGEYIKKMEKEKNKIIASKLYLIGKLFFDLSSLNPKYEEDAEKYRQEASQLNDMFVNKQYKKIEGH